MLVSFDAVRPGGCICALGRSRHAGLDIRAAFVLENLQRTKKEGRALAPFHCQRIAHWGACRKTPVVPQNRPSTIRSLRDGELDECRRRCRRTIARQATSRNATGRVRSELIADPLTTSAFDLPDHLAAKADPALIADDEQHFAAIAESLEQSIAELSDRLDAERMAPGGDRPGGDGPGPGDPPADRPPARPASLRSGSVPRPHGQRQTIPSRCTSADSASPTAPVASCCSTGAPPPPSRSSARPTPTRWVWPADAGIAGPAAGSATTGTRCSPPTGSTGTRRARRPVRLHRQPGQQPVVAGCATCSAPSRPTRTRSSARDPAARSSSTAAPVRARPSSRCTAPPTCSTPTLGSVTAGVACCSSVRTSPTWPTSPTSCPASARRACRPAPCAISSPREPQRRIETDPDVARLKSSAELVKAIEPAVRFYEEPPTKGMTVATRLVRRSG